VLLKPYSEDELIPLSGLADAVESHRGRETRGRMAARCLGLPFSVDVFLWPELTLLAVPHPVHPKMSVSSSCLPPISSVMLLKKFAGRFIRYRGIFIQYRGRFFGLPGGFICFPGRFISVRGGFILVRGGFRNDI